MKWRGIWQTESLPIGYGGPVYGKHPEEIFSTLQTVIHKQDKSKRQTIRIFGEEAFGLSGVFYEWGFSPVMSDCLPIIDLSLGIENVIKAFSAANRRDLKRAERFSVKVQETPCQDADMNSFYDLYRSTMEKLEVASIKEFSFFKDLSRIFRDESSLMTAHADGKMVAARLHLKDPYRSRIHYLFSANSLEGKHCLAGSKLHKHSLQWALSEGYRIYDMGSTLADVRDALYKYKVKWGARVQVAPQWVRIKHPFIFKSLKFAKSVLHRQ